MSTAVCQQIPPLPRVLSCPRLSPSLHSIVDNKMVSPTTSLHLTLSSPFVVLLKGPPLSRPQPSPLLYSVLVNTMASTERSPTILPVTVPSPLCQHHQQCPPRVLHGRVDSNVPPATILFYSYCCCQHRCVDSNVLLMEMSHCLVSNIALRFFEEEQQSKSHNSISCHYHSTNPPPEGTLVL